MTALRSNHFHLPKQSHGAAARAGTKLKAAFTILEVLVVIAVIGIMASLSFLFFGPFHNDVLLKVRNQRNAQEICAIVMGATSAGAEVMQVNDTEATVRNLIEGRVGNNGAFKGYTFRLTYLSPEEMSGAVKYLKWTDGLLTYNYEAPTQ